MAASDLHNRADWALHLEGVAMTAADKTAAGYMARWHAYDRAVSSQRRGWPGDSAAQLLDLVT